MNKTAIVFYHSGDSFVSKELLLICTKLQISLFDCTTLSQLHKIFNVVDPAYVIFDENFDSDLLYDYANAYREKIYFYMSDNYGIRARNVFIVKDNEELCRLLPDVYNKDIFKIDVDSNFCYAFITNELKKLGFSSKHVGVTYLRELVAEIYSKKNYNCKAIYRKIAEKYTTTVAGIEKSIRFCIQRAYAKRNMLQLSLFGNSMSVEDTTVPTIKELSTFLVEKLMIEEKW